MKKIFIKNEDYDKYDYFVTIPLITLKEAKDLIGIEELPLHNDNAGDSTYGYIHKSEGDPWFEEYTVDKIKKEFKSIKII